MVIRTTTKEMEGKAIFKALFVAAMLQACYCGTPSYRVITSYTDADCTKPTGGVTIVQEYSGCNPYPCSSGGGMYTTTTCEPNDPLTNGFPYGVALRFSYSTTAGTCTGHYTAVRYAPPGACFIDENITVRSFAECSGGQLDYFFWTGDYAECAAATTAPLTDTLTVDTCRITDGTDDKGVCAVALPVSPPVNPPVNPPMAEPMAVPMTAPMAQPVAAPVKAPVMAPSVRSSGAVANSVAMITIGMIVLFL